MSFLSDITKYAAIGWQKYKINPTLTLAQAILESGNGQSGLTKGANNVFGIKSTQSWLNSGGQATTMATKEDDGNGNYYTINAGFRKYNSIEESFNDYFNLLSGASRYSKVLNVKDNVKVLELQGTTGYATDTRYSQKLKNVAEQYGLYEIANNIMDSNGLLESDTSNNINFNIKSSYNANNIAEILILLAIGLVGISGVKKLIEN